MAGNIGALSIELLGNGAGLSRVLQKAGREVDVWGNKTNRAAAAVGFGLMGIGVGVAAMGSIAVRSFMAFDDAMTKSLSILTDVSKEMRSQMEETAKSIVKNTVFSATDAAQAYFFLGSAGMTAAQQLRAMPVVANFATAGVLSMKSAAEKLMDVQRSLGLAMEDPIANMKQLTRVSDVLAKANTIANATAGQFADALKGRLGAALKMFGKSVEEGAAALAVYANRGIKGTTAGRFLDIALRELSVKASINADVFKRLGVNVFDSTGKMRNIADVVESLTKLTVGLTDEQKTQTFQLLGLSQRASSFIRILMGSSEEMRKYERELKKASGTSEEMRKKQMEALQAQFTKLGNTVNSASIELGGMVAESLNLKDAISGLSYIIQEFSDWLKRLTPFQKNLITYTVSGAAAVASLAGAFKLLNIAAKATIGLNIASAFSNLLAPISGLALALKAGGISAFFSTLGSLSVAGLSAIIGVGAALLQWVALPAIVGALSYAIGNFISKVTGLHKVLGDVIASMDYFDVLGNKATNNQIELANATQKLLGPYKEYMQIIRDANRLDLSGQVVSLMSGFSSKSLKEQAGVMEKLRQLAMEAKNNAKSDEEVKNAETKNKLLLAQERFIQEYEKSVFAVLSKEEQLNKIVKERGQLLAQLQFLGLDVNKGNIAQFLKDVSVADIRNAAMRPEDIETAIAAAQKLIDLESRIVKIRDRGLKKVESLQDKMNSIFQDADDSFATSGELIAKKIAERAKLLQMLRNTDDSNQKYDLLGKIAELTGDITKETKAQQSEVTGPRFASALQEGSIQAYNDVLRQQQRLENKNETAKNTAKLVKLQEDNNKLQKELNAQLKKIDPERVADERAI